MIFRVSLSLYLVGLAGAVLSQERGSPDAGEAIAEAVPIQEERSQETVAGCDVQFVDSDDPFDMELFRADPRLLEQKFVAVLLSECPGKGRAGAKDVLPNELAKLWHFPPSGPSSRQRGGRLSQSLTPVQKRSTQGLTSLLEEYFGELAKRVPAERRPSDEVLAILSAGEMSLQFRPVTSSGDKNGRYFEFRVLAPTRLQCKELSQALLILLDEGLSRPSVRHVRHLAQAKQEELAGQAKKRDDAAAKLEEIETQLAKPVEVRSEDLPRLMPQQHLLKVDLAGVKARIAAAEKILSRSEGLTASRTEQVENIKITAEIDLAGLAARQRTLQQIVEKGKRRADLEGERSRAQEDHNQRSSIASRTEQRIRVYEMYAKEFGPLPLLSTGDKVLIQPIRWRERQ